MSASEGEELHQLQARVAGRYSIEREIGRGGMGIVYLARDIALDRRVAIKLLPREYVVEATLRERFIREARLAARLSHPHIVPVYAVEEHAEAVFYAMGYIEGENLAARIERVGQLAPAEVATIVQQVAWALAYAHGNGVVHRDIKPDNILIEQGTGRSWVMDFGIARAFGGATGEQKQATKLTQVGHVVGTAAYMSPEQASGEDVDGRSDLYSLGVVAYQALTGRLPLEATSAQALLVKHLTETPPPIASVRPGVPAALAKTIDQLLAKDPAARPKSGEAVAEALAATQAARAEVAPPIRNFLRIAEQEVLTIVRFLAIMLAVTLGRPGALLPIAMASLGTFAGAVAALFFRARRLIQGGYRWPDVRDAVALYAQERFEENREVAVAPAPGALRRAAIRAALSLTIGISIFIGAAIWAKSMQKAHVSGAVAIGTTLVIIGSVLMTISMMPLAYFIAMRMSAKARASGKDRRGFALAIWASPFSRLLFTYAARNIAPQPPRNAAAALDQLVTETEAAVPTADRRIVRDLRRRLEALASEAHSLRSRERELDRAIAEAGPGAVADQIGAARKEIAPRVERIAALTDEARLKLLLVRSGVRPASELRELLTAP